jgi:hypothetical protein
MSFRHTYITNFLYKAPPLNGDLVLIKEILSKYGTVEWGGKDEMLGFYYGIIRDSDGKDTLNQNVQQEINDNLEKFGAEIKIVYE